MRDPPGREIVGRRADGDEPWCGIFELGLSKATLSHHFRVLRESGVVRTRPEGTVNPNLPTGEVEVAARTVEVLNEALAWVADRVHVTGRELGSRH